MRKHIRLILLGVALVLLTGHLVLRLTAPGHRMTKEPRLVGAERIFTSKWWFFTTF